MSGKHKLAWSEGQQLRLIHAGSLEIYFDKCYRNMEGEPVLKKASITQRQSGLHCVGFVSLFGDLFDVRESTLLRSQRSRGSQQKSGSLTPERGWLTAKKCFHFAIEIFEMSNIEAVCKEVRR